MDAAADAINTNRKDLCLCINPYFLCYSATYGSNAIDLALFIALVTILWCLAQAPVILLGNILPLSVVYFFNLPRSL
jgi:hypothetical protein